MNNYFSWRNSGEAMPADHFGYWSFRWATESASSFLDSLLGQPLEGWALQKAIDDKPFRALNHLTAFFVVPYWLYALDVLKINKEVMSAMRRGMGASIGDLRDSDDIALSKENVALIQETFKRYLESERTERTQVLSAGAEANDLEVGRVAALFLGDMYRIYGETEISTAAGLEGDFALRQNLLAAKTSIYEMLHRELELKAAN